MRLKYVKLGSYGRVKDADGRYVCLNCNEPILVKKRRKYCSDRCLNEFIVRNSHKLLRKKLIRESRSRCYKCNEKFDSVNLVLDHITPLALGGSEFDESNLQILCAGCNKEKTRMDFNKIITKRQFSS